MNPLSHIKNGDDEFIKHGRNPNDEHRENKSSTRQLSVRNSKASLGRQTTSPFHITIRSEKKGDGGGAIKLKITLFHKNTYTKPTPEGMKQISKRHKCTTTKTIAESKARFTVAKAEGSKEELKVSPSFG